MAGRADEAVRVVVQARPLLRGEAAGGAALALAPPADVRLARAAPSAAHAALADGGAGGAGAGVDVFGPYDAVCEPGDGAAGRLYAAWVAPLVESAFEGVNGTVMAYGQTASGKTYTMAGMSGMAAEHVFGLAGERSGGRNVTVRVGFVEIYQEAIRDLVDGLPQFGGGGGGGGGGRAGGAVNVTVRTRRNGDVFLDGAREVPVRNAHQLESLVAAGARLRQTAVTGMNEASSRSHSIVTITVQQEPFDAAPAGGGGGGGGFLSAKLHLVDLAGSERTKRCTASGGARFAEGVSINGGLLALAKVISALADGAPHVPYRESNLTRLLQDSLGGNSRSLVVACVSPAAASREETASTLRYAMRIKNIRNRPRVNVDPASVENSDLRAALARARAQIAALRAELDLLRKGRGPPPSPAAAHALSAADPQQPIPQLRLQASTSLPAAAETPDRPARGAPRRSQPSLRPAASSSAASSPAKPPLSSSSSPALAAAALSSATNVTTRRRGARTAAGKAAAANTTTAAAAPGQRTPPRAHATAASPAASPDMEPGSLMGRLAELEELLHEKTPTRSRGERSDSRSSSISPGTTRPRDSAATALTSPPGPPDVDVVAEEAAAARRGLSSLVEDAAALDGRPAGSRAPKRTATDRDAQLRVSYDRKVAAAEQARAAAELAAADLSAALAMADKAHAADLKTRDAEHQACIAELRSRLGDLQKRDVEGGRRGDLARVDTDRQRLVRRLKAAESALEEANAKLADRSLQSGQSKSTLLRENRNLTKQENLLRVRVRRLEAIRARQADQIQEHSARDKLAAIERHQNRQRGTARDGPSTDTSLASASSASSTITPHQRQQWLERELMALAVRRGGRAANAPDEDARDKARHWAWVRSMDDAKVLLKMCLVQLSEARSSPAGPVGAAEVATEVALPKKAERPSHPESRTTRRSSAGCGAPLTPASSPSLRRSSSTTLHSRRLPVSPTGGR